MKIHDVRQGSTEWLKLRLGIPTASKFDHIVTPGGKPSSSQDSYLRELLAEVIMGRPIEEIQTSWMERGQLLESKAVEYYEFENDVDTVPVGFITTDDGSYGASPDRLVGENALLEIKCPKPETHVDYLLYSGAAKKYMPQLQGQLLVTGRDYVDIVSYHPDMPTAVSRVHRDEEFIKTLERKLIAFTGRLQAKVEIVRERGWLKADAPPPKEWITQADIEAILESRKLANV